MSTTHTHSSKIIETANANGHTAPSMNFGLSEKAADVYNAIHQEAETYIVKGKQVVDDAKGKAVQLQGGAQKVIETAQQRTQEYVDTAKRTTEPYLNGARQAVDSSKVQVEALKTRISQSTKHISTIDITKTVFFGRIVTFAAIAIFYAWYILSMIPFAHSAANSLLLRMERLGVHKLVSEVSNYTLVLIARVPVVGSRTSEVLQALYKNTTQEALVYINKQQAKKTA